MERPSAVADSEYVAEENSGSAHAAVSKGTVISQSSKGKRIAVLTHGTRGDVQPLIALCAQLQASGFVLLVTTNRDHVRFFERFGLDARGLRFDMESEFVRPEVQQAMADGDTAEVFALVGERHARDWETAARQLWDCVREFGPDLILSTPLEEFLCRIFAHCLNVPCVGTALQLHFPTSEVPSVMGERFLHRVVWNLIAKQLYKELQLFLPEIERVFAAELAQAGDLVQYATWANSKLDSHCPIEPYLLGLSELFVLRPKDWPQTLAPVLFAGFWVVDQGEQERRLQRQDSKFGGDALDPLVTFLESGPAPAYLGWGSMVVAPPSRLAVLAVRALRAAGLRGVVLGGWAKLHAEMLRGYPDLEAYATSNVLFVSSAPHEWLFPRCVLTVHHGGAGTTAAAVRAGVPTIVTPAFADQYQSAALVRRSGCGLRLQQLAKVTAPELAKAMSRCVNNAELRKAAASLGQRLRAEDGVGVAVAAVDRFLSQDVASGEWARRKEERKREHERIAARQGSCC